MVGNLESRERIGIVQRTLSDLNSRHSDEQTTEQVCAEMHLTYANGSESARPPFRALYVLLIVSPNIVKYSASAHRDDLAYSRLLQITGAKWSCAP